MSRIVLTVALALSASAAVAQDATVGWAMLPALEGIDVDGDGLYSPEEIGGTTVPESFDLDGDGFFSVVELSQGYFALADANDDGYLDPGELQAMDGLPAAGVYIEEL